MSKIITATDIVKSYRAVQDQDDANTAGLITARELRIGAFRETYEGIHVLKTTNASKVAAEVKATREAGQPVPEDFAYESNQAVGYVATAGELLTLPGELPEAAVIGRIAMMVKETGHQVARKIIRRKGQTVDVAYLELKALTDTIVNKRKSDAQTPEKLIKAAQGPLSKALEMDIADYSDEAVKLLQSVFAGVGSKLEAIAAAKAAAKK